MFALLLLLASPPPTPVLPYPVRAVHFELRAGDAVRCDCIHLNGGSVDRSLLTADEKVRLDDLIARVGDTWETADERQRATMMVDYLRLATVGRTTYYSETVLSCSDGLRARATSVLTSSGETASLLRDLDTDEYLMHLHTTKGSPAEFIKLLFELPRQGKAAGQQPSPPPSDAEIERKVEELTQRFAKDLETRLDSWDVNGQVYLPLPGAKGPEVYGELNALWSNFSPEAGRHIKAMWGVLEAFDNGEVSCDGDGGEPLAAGPALDPDYLLASRPPKLSCRPDEALWMRRSSFQLPDGELVRKLTGSKEWNPLPPDVSFAEAVRWLRRRT
jgi:hypothetical protein